MVHGFVSVLAATVLVFVSTNTDDLFTLVVFMAQVDGKTTRTWHVIIGQFLGFTVLNVVCLLGIILGKFVPADYLGLLGFLPLLNGFYKLFKQCKRLYNKKFRPDLVPRDSSDFSATHVELLEHVSEDTSNGMELTKVNATPLIAEKETTEEIVEVVTQPGHEASPSSPAAGDDFVMVDQEASTKPDVVEANQNEENNKRAVSFAVTSTVTRPEVRPASASLSALKESTNISRPLSVSMALATEETAAKEEIKVDTSVVEHRRTTVALPRRKTIITESIGRKTLRVIAEKLAYVFNPRSVEVALVVIADGGDSLTTVLPLFATEFPEEILFSLFLFYTLTLIFCFVAVMLVKWSIVAKLMHKYGGWIRPLMLISLGLYILSDSIIGKMILPDDDDD